MNGVEITVLVLSLVDAFCCLVCRVPQIVRLYKLKESNAISVPYWVASILSCLMCITAYALKIFSLGEMTTIIFFCSAIMNLVLNFIVLYLTIYYRKHQKLNVSQE
ncbi:MAG: hypothetical protein K5906_04910 [Bacilli bacterium]|nr:hypothetical protein [Bacilli bacterium]